MNNFYRPNSIIVKSDIITRELVRISVNSNGVLTIYNDKKDE